MHLSHNPLTINSQDKSDGDYRPEHDEEEDEHDEDCEYDTGSEEEEHGGGAARWARAPMTATKWPRNTMVVTEVDEGGMPVPLTQKRRFTTLAGLIARQEIPLHLSQIKKLSKNEKWYLFDQYLQKHLTFQEDMKQ